MIRWERAIVGLVLVAAGGGVAWLGYQKSQPTQADHVIGIIEQLSGEAAPPELKSSKIEAHAMIGGGLLAAAAGLAVIWTVRGGGPGGMA